MAKTWWRKGYFEAGIGVVVIDLIFGGLYTLTHFYEELVDVVFEDIAGCLVA